MSNKHDDAMWGLYEKASQRRGYTSYLVTDDGIREVRGPSRCETIIERLDAIERKQAKQERQIAEIEKKYPWGGY